MPAGAFHIQIYLRGREVLERLGGKLLNWIEPLGEMKERWSAHNEAKMELGQGAEESGVQMAGSDAFWAALSPEYLAEKRKNYDNWLMVRDGSLLESLTNPDDPAFYDETFELGARFGTISPGGVFNQETRPTAFLDEEDGTMIGSLASAWLNDDAPFRPWAPSQAQLMDAEFSAIVAAG